MKVTKLSLFIAILIFIGCQSKQKKASLKIAPETVALNFINEYINNIGNLEMVEWVTKNSNTTEKFKADLKKMVDDGEKEAPGYGLGFDPILDAQDYPDKGFLLKSVDTTSTYITVVGREWESFELTIRLIENNDKWMVDGCGVVNIPLEKQASRD
ncbi:MAG: hypothetical protein JXR05_04200 [Flavobacteriaceae bacterium]